MKKVLFLLLYSQFLFGLNNNDFYKAWSHGYDIAVQNKEDSTLNTKKYCISKYKYSSDLAWYCGIGAVGGKTGMKKLSYKDLFE